MRRVEDWPERLLALVEEHRQQPFQWGKNDCCTFAGEAVARMTGADLLADVRGRYNSARSAAVVMARVGGLGAYLGERLPPVAPKLARRGDVVMFESIEGPALGIALGVYAVGVGPEGVTWVAMARWTKLS